MAQAARSTVLAPKTRQIVLVTSNKGGTGKTTTAIHLALASAYEGANVCIVDLDTQRSADSWSLQRRKYSGLPQVPVYSGNIDRFRATMAMADRHDLVVIDTPPDVSGHAQAFNSMIDMADSIVVPCLTGPFDLKAVGPYVQDVLKPAKGYKVAILMNRVSMRSVAYRTAYEFLSKRGRICGVPIRQFVAIEERMMSGHSVLDDETIDKGKEDFARLWTWVSQELDR